MTDKTQKVTFYLSGARFTTNLTDEDTALVKEAASHCWRGVGPPVVSVGGGDGSSPVLVNLARVDLIQTEESSGG